MESNIFTAVITVASTVIGTLLGWYLSYIQASLSNKVKLSFSLQPYNTDLSSEIELQTKYSESGYAIYIYNTGKTPILLEKISLYVKKTTIVDCVLSNVETLMPYNQYTYTLSVQEYDAILYHCRNSDISKCDVFGYDVCGNSSKASLDLFIPKIQVNNRNRK